MTSGDSISAARKIVAWFVTQDRIPGFEEDYIDSHIMKTRTEFIVICDFLPPDCNLSEDPRVRRMTAADYDRRMRQLGTNFHGTDYITIELVERSIFQVDLSVSNVFGMLGGHGYDFTFYKRFFRLLARGEETWVS